MTNSTPNSNQDNSATTVILDGQWTIEGLPPGLTVVMLTLTQIAGTVSGVLVLSTNGNGGPLHSTVSGSVEGKAVRLDFKSADAEPLTFLGTATSASDIPGQLAGWIEAPVTLVSVS